MDAHNSADCSDGHDEMNPLRCDGAVKIDIRFDRVGFFVILYDEVMRCIFLFIFLSVQKRTEPSPRNTSRSAGPNKTRPIVPVPKIP